MLPTMLSLFLLFISFFLFFIHIVIDLLSKNCPGLVRRESSLNFKCLSCFMITVYLERSRWQSAMETLHDISTVVSNQANLVAQMKSRLSSIGKLNDKDRPLIFAITPTFARPVQKAELTRLAQTFLHVPNFYWIVVEDSAAKTNLVTNFLKESGLVYTHLNAITPSTYKLGKNDPNWKKPRGVEQRNAALRWIRENLNDSVKGVVYFADDDNTYAVKLFREVRSRFKNSYFVLQNINE